MSLSTRARLLATCGTVLASLAAAPVAMADTGSGSHVASTSTVRTALSRSSACNGIHVGYTGPLLRYGARGSAVRAVQCVIIVWSRTSIAVDGIYGPATRMKVIGFQRAHGLYPDGVVGPATWRTIYHYYWGR